MSQKNYRAGVEEVNYKSWSCSFTRLRHVKLQNVSGAGSEVEFMKFLLISSPVLQTMTIVPQPDEPYTIDDDPNVIIFDARMFKVLELSRFRGASPNAKIEFSKY